MENRRAPFYLRRTKEAMVYFPEKRSLSCTTPNNQRLPARSPRNNKHRHGRLEQRPQGRSRRFGKTSYLLVGRGRF
jgi:hypothetical protein